MRKILQFATARAVMCTALAVILAGAAMEEFSSQTVGDAKALTITGGQCTSATRTNGTQSCLTTSCPEDNLVCNGAGTSCVNTNASCGNCTCTYSGPMCRGAGG